MTIEQIEAEYAKHDWCGPRDLRSVIAYSDAMQREFREAMNRPPLLNQRVNADGSLAIWANGAPMPPLAATDEELLRLASDLRAEIGSHIQAVIDEGDGCEAAPDAPTIHCRREDEECKPYRAQF